MLSTQPRSHSALFFSFFWFFFGFLSCTRAPAYRRRSQRGLPRTVHFFSFFSFLLLCIPLLSTPPPYRRSSLRGPRFHTLRVFILILNSYFPATRRPLIPHHLYAPLGALEALASISRLVLLPFLSLFIIIYSYILSNTPLPSLIKPSSESTLPPPPTRPSGTTASPTTR